MRVGLGFEDLVLRIVVAPGRARDVQNLEVDGFVGREFGAGDERSFPKVVVRLVGGDHGHHPPLFQRLEPALHRAAQLALAKALAAGAADAAAVQMTG